MLDELRLESLNIPRKEATAGHRVVVRIIVISYYSDTAAAMAMRWHIMPELQGLRMRLPDRLRCSEIVGHVDTLQLRAALRILPYGYCTRLDSLATPKRPHL